MERFIDSIIPLAAMALVFGIPLAAILTGHQRKMVELMNKREGNATSSEEINRLRLEVAELRDRVNQQALVLEQSRSLMLGTERKQDQERV